MDLTMTKTLALGTGAAVVALPTLVHAAGKKADVVTVGIPETWWTVFAIIGMVSTGMFSVALVGYWLKKFRSGGGMP